MTILNKFGMWNCSLVFALESMVLVMREACEEGPTGLHMVLLCFGLITNFILGFLQVTWIPKIVIGCIF